MKDPRPHQTLAVTMLRESLRSGHKRPMLKLSVAAGKTVIAAMIIRQALAKGNRVMFICDAVTLIDQTVRAFAAEGITDVGVIQRDHPLTNWDARVQVASIQTLMRRVPPPFQLCITDEAHVVYEELKALMKDNPNVPFIGLSATPFTKGLGLVYDDLLKPASMKDLIADGYVMPVTAYAPSNPDFSHVTIRAGDYDEDQVAAIMGDAKIMADVVDTWKELGENRPTFAFSPNCAHAQDVADRFCAAGIPWGYVDGKTPELDRMEVRRKLDAGEIYGVSSVAALIKGIDWRVAAVIWMAKTKSPTKLVQGIGRALRDNPPWKDAIVLDHTGSMLILGLPADIDIEHMDTSQRGEKAKHEAKSPIQPSPCPKCKKLKTAKVCVCGFSAPRQTSDIVESAGTLARIGDGKKGPSKSEITPSDKAKFYAELKGYVVLKGKKPGFADAMFKTKHGHWPAVKHGIEPRDPSPETLSYIRSRQIAYAKGMQKRESV